MNELYKPFIVLAAVVCTYFVCSEEPTTSSSSDHEKTCKELDLVRANYLDCCKYPSLGIMRERSEQCLLECSSLVQNEEIQCCSMVCSYRAINVLAPAESNAENFTFNPTQGLIASFMLSANNTEWTNTITESVEYCVKIFPEQATFDSCGIPNHIFNIIECAHTENYYKCPIWNLDKIDGCDLTREYVDLCLRTKVK